MGWGARSVGKPFKLCGGPGGGGAGKGRLPFRLQPNVTQRETQTYFRTSLPLLGVFVQFWRFFVPKPRRSLAEDKRFLLFVPGDRPPQGRWRCPHCVRSAGGAPKRPGRDSPQRRRPPGTSLVSCPTAWAPAPRGLSPAGVGGVRTLAGRVGQLEPQAPSWRRSQCDLVPAQSQVGKKERLVLQAATRTRTLVLSRRALFGTFLSRHLSCSKSSSQIQR